MKLSPDEALKYFKMISKHNWTGLTESDTRVKLIDKIFVESLNWDENENITREEHASPGFVDYVFRLGKKNVFVVEAKKQGVYFNLPISLNFKRKYTVGGILSTDKTLREAMTQAQGYCSRKGARYGVITNGTQFIIFESTVAFEDWDNGNCRIFYNLEDIERNFMEFWNLLSKDAVERGSLVECLSKKADELIFVRPVDNIIFRNEIQPRNELHEYMNDIIKFAFKDIIDKDRIEMLRRCYVSEREFHEPTRSIKNHFTLDLESNFNIKRVTESRDNSGVFQAEFNYYSEVIKATPPSPVVFLLLGKIGSGKTTFIFRFFNVVLTDEERRVVKLFYVNIKDAPKDEKYIREYLFHKILENFETDHRELLVHIKSQLKMEKVTSCMDDLSRLFLVLRFEGFTPALVIDNVDQHSLEMPSFHEKVFLEANNLTNELRTITIMTLREESFYRSAIQGVFDAYYIEKYIIDPPDLRRILLTRIDYVLEKMDLPNQELKILLKSNLNYERRRADIKNFLVVVRDTIFKSYRRSVVKFLSGTSGGDVRRALELFERFLPSGNIKIDEILDTYKRTGTYTIAEHQFVKSIALGSHRYFSKQSSFLMNIFEIDEFSMSHFLKLKILSYAEERASIDSPLERGFIAINELIKHSYEISIPQEAVEQSLLELAKYGLIILNTRSRETLEGASHFRITECGNYYLRVLPNRFSYINLVLADTPIADSDLVKKLRNMLPSKDIDIRFERSKLFIMYLREMEDRETRFNPEYENSPLGKYKFTKKIEASLEEEQKYVRASKNSKDTSGYCLDDDY